MAKTTCRRTNLFVLLIPEGDEAMLVGSGHGDKRQAWQTELEAESSLCHQKQEAESELKASPRL